MNHRLAREPAAGRRRHATAARPYRVGIIGCGNVARRRHLPAWLQLTDRFQVVAVADPLEESRETVRNLLGLPGESAHADWSELLSRPDIDVVDICTPQHVRAAAVAAAVEAGVHVLAEKPLCTVPAEAARIAGLVDDADVRLATIHNYLHFPEVRAVTRLVEADAIGDVEVVALNYLGVEDRPGTDGYSPRWRHGTGAGGGVLMDMLHALYLAEALLGHPVRRVSACVRARAADAEVEDLALCRLETDANVGLVNVGWGLGAGGMDVSGIGGRISVHYRNGGTSPFAPLESVTVTTRDGSRLVPVDPEPPHRSFAAVFSHFADALDSGREAASSARAGGRVLEMVLAAYESAVLNRAVEIPLATDDPVYRMGLAGLSDLEMPPSSGLQGSRLYGLTGAAEGEWSR